MRYSIEYSYQLNMDLAASVPEAFNLPEEIHLCDNGRAIVFHTFLDPQNIQILEKEDDAFNNVPRKLYTKTKWVKPLRVDL